MTTQTGTERPHNVETWAKTIFTIPHRNTDLGALWEQNFGPMDDATRDTINRVILDHAAETKASRQAEQAEAAKKADPIARTGARLLSTISTDPPPPLLIDR